jgi:hypothetical protein
MVVVSLHDSVELEAYSVTFTVSGLAYVALEISFVDDFVPLPKSQEKTSALLEVF